MALDIILYVLAVVAIALVLFPFSPMTLKFYMPKREAMLHFHRYRGLWTGIGLAFFAVIVIRVIVGAATPGWGWAVLGGLIFFGFFYWGGYVPVIMHAPKIQQRVSSQDADSLIKPEQDVLGVVVDGEARAYSREQLTRPHVVHDEVAGTRLAVTYCILCNTAVAFKAELKGKPLNFLPITAFNNNIMYYDSTSKNYIQQLDGRVISGPDAREKLEALPVSITTWQAWKELHPDTEFVHLPATGFRDKMLTWMLSWMIPLPGLAKRKGPWHPVKGQIDKGLPAMSMVVGVEFGDQQRVYPMDTLREHKVINDTVGDEPIVVLYDQERDAVCVYSRQVDGQVLNFQNGPEEANRIIAVDQESGTRWDINGAGYQKDSGVSDRALEPLPHFNKLFWFSWSLFKSKTDIKQVM